jgi:glycosyltransferase involved in cell wall biosynthesis
MTQGPLVSVLTPAYNRAEFLAECIESVQAQTYTNWEYIIVNNCSTDDTLEVVRRYAATDSRIRVYSNDVLLDLNSNHNLAFSLMSPASK